MPNYDYMRRLIATAREKPERLPKKDVLKRKASKQAVEGPRKRLIQSTLDGIPWLQPEE